MKYSHSFHSLEAKKGPMSFTFGHIHPGKLRTKGCIKGRGGGRVGVAAGASPHPEGSLADSEASHWSDVYNLDPNLFTDWE